jgi:uncharacterized membrane protein YraQ (UPF0718 family)
VHDHEHEHEHEDSGKGNNLIMALRAAMRDFVDVGIYFAIGITIVAVVNTPPPFDNNAVPLRDIIDGTADSTWGAPAALMGLAFHGARLAFLVFGPMMDVKLLFLYSTILTKKFILYLAIGLFITIGAISVFMEPLFESDVPIPRMGR